MRRPPRPPLPSRISFVWPVLGGVVIPAACFLVAALMPQVMKPTSRQDGWRGMIVLLAHPHATHGVGILLAGAAVALLMLLLDFKRHQGSIAARTFTYGGLAISLFYCAVGLLSILASFILAGFGLVLIAWGIRTLACKLARGPTGADAILLVLGCIGCVVLAAGEPAALLVLLATGPLWAALAYGSMALRLQQAPPLPKGSLRDPLLAWSVGFGLSLWHAFTRANEIFATLPERTQCYVVTAAARGHACFVGRRKGGATIQLLWLKAAEIVMAERAPRVHRMLRRVYDRVGPPLARCIQNPFAADLAYLLLKPLEWGVRGLASRVARPSTGPQRHERSESTPVPPPPGGQARKARRRGAAA